MALEVRVGWKHINGAVPASSCQCPVARALQEQHPMGALWCVYLKKHGKDEDNVTGQAVLWPGRGYGLPPKAVRFILDLLAGKPVQPVTFMLEE